MQALQALHQELDVPNAPRIQLHVQRGHGPRLARLLNAVARGRQRLDLGKIGGGAVDARRDHVQELAPQGLVPGHRARLEQHLQLPVARPPEIVLRGGRDRDDQFAGIALRAQPEVDPVAEALGRNCGQQACQPLGQLRGEVLVGRRYRPVGLALAGVDVHQVDVGAVVELGPAQLAQRDDGEAANDLPGAGIAQGAPETPDQLLPDMVMRGLDQHFSQAGKIPRGLGQGREAEQVPHRDPQHLVPLDACQLHRHCLVGSVSEERTDLRAQFAGDSGPLEIFRFQRPAQQFRMGEQQAGQVAAVAENCQRRVDRVAVKVVGTSAGGGPGRRTAAAAATRRADPAVSPRSAESARWRAQRGARRASQAAAARTRRCWTWEQPARAALRSIPAPPGDLREWHHGSSGCGGRRRTAHAQDVRIGLGRGGGAGRRDPAGEGQALA